MARETAILVTLVTYKVVLVLIGVLAARRTRDGADFFIGGRKLGPIVSAVSASASSSSAWTLLGVSGAAYLHGLSALWLFPACVGGFCLNWFLLARPLRALSHARGAITATDLISGEEDEPLHRARRTTAGIIILFSLTAYVASQFGGAGRTFAATFDLDESAGVLLGAGVIVFYTLLGGFWAVSVTDTLQGLVMAAACIIVPGVALVAVGGPIALVERLGEVPVEGFVSPVGGLGPLAALVLVAGYLGIGLGYPGQPHVVNRLMALEDGEAPLRRARAVAVAWAVVVYSGMLVLGWCGRVLLAGVSDPEVVLLRTANGLLPPVLAGVVIAAVLSAIMSTADSQLLVAASALTHDMRGRGPARAGFLLRSRLVVLALSILAVTLALVDDRSIYESVLFAWTAMGAAFGPLLCVRALCGPLAPLGSYLAMLAGFSLAVVFYYRAPELGGMLWERVVPFVVALAIAASSARRKELVAAPPAE